MLDIKKKNMCRWLLSLNLLTPVISGKVQDLMTTPVPVFAAQFIKEVLPTYDAIKSGPEPEVEMHKFLNNVFGCDLPGETYSKILTYYECFEELLRLKGRHDVIVKEEQ